MSDTFFLTVGIVLLVIGGLIFLAAVSNSISCSKKVTAKVVKVERDSTRHWKGSYPHYPVVSFAVNGKEYTVKSSTYTRSRAKYKVGQEVVIRYNPKKPEEIQIGVDLSSYIVSAVLMGLGGTLIVVYCAYCL